MSDAELTLADLREPVKRALEGIAFPFPVAVRQSWPREAAEGVIITYQEYDNHSTACSVVDFVEVQVDLWAYDRESVRVLAGLVNRAMLEMGLKRTYMGPELMEHGTYERKTMRFGRNIDKRWMRPVG